MDASTVRRNRIAQLMRAVGGVLFMGALAGCGSDANTPTVGNSHIFWTLQLNHEAIELALPAPYDTVQLTATALDDKGASLVHAGTATYSLADTTDSTVIVSPTGLVTARYATVGTNLTKVIASLRDTTQGITHVDTAFIVVTQTANPLQSFTLQPASGDSAKRALGDQYQNWPLQFVWSVRATNTQGDTVCNASRCALNILYHSSNSIVASINGRTGLVTALDTGHVVFTATTYAYGHSWRDSVVFAIRPSLSFFAFYHPAYSDQNGRFYGPIITTVPDTLILSAGAQIDFVQLGIYSPFQFTFTHPEDVDSTQDISFLQYSGSGNVSFACDSLVSFDCYTFDANFNVTYNELDKARRFPVPGTYVMVSSLFPEQKTVILVQP